jgi:hypothetical protein
MVNVTMVITGKHLVADATSNAGDLTNADFGI